MFFNANANDINRYDYVRSPDQAILHQEQSIFQGRFTWQANPKHKIGVTFDQESFCACTTGIGPQPGGARVARGRQRSALPAAAIRHG